MCAACAPPMRHWYAIDTQHMRNSSAGNVPPNHLGDPTAYLYIIFSYAVRAQWRRRPVEQGHKTRNLCVIHAFTRIFGSVTGPLACSKFDGARCARGVCLAHLCDSTAHHWRTHGVNEDHWAYVAYLPRICYFFYVRRASAVASPASGPGAY